MHPVIGGVEEGPESPSEPPAPPPDPSPPTLRGQSFCPYCDGIGGHLTGCPTLHPPPPPPERVRPGWKQLAARALRKLATRIESSD